MADTPSACPDSVRRTYLRAEAAVRAISWIYFIVALLLCASIVTMFRSIDLHVAQRVGIAALLVVLACCFVWVGLQFLRLNPLIRLPGVILSCLGLFTFPIGTFLHGYALCLLFSRSGRYVLSRDYRAIVVATPEIRYRMSPLMIAAGVLLALLLLGVVIAGATR